MSHGPAVASSPPCLLGGVSVPVLPGFSVVASHVQHSSGALSGKLAVTSSPHCSLGSVPPCLLLHPMCNILLVFRLLGRV